MGITSTESTSSEDPLDPPIGAQQSPSNDHVVQSLRSCVPETPKPAPNPGDLVNGPGEVANPHNCPSVIKDHQRTAPSQYLSETEKSHSSQTEYTRSTVIQTPSIGEKSFEGTIRASSNSQGSVSESWDGNPRTAHTAAFGSVSAYHNVDPTNGLDSATAADRLRDNGSNQLESNKGLSVWKILLRQVSNSLTIILLIALGLAYGTFDFIEGAVITAVILLNVVVGFVQDYNAEKTMQSLLALTAPFASVLRDGCETSVPAANLVVGDIVLVSVGDIIPADLRLLTASNLETNEALLTGEALPIPKDATVPLVLIPLQCPLGDRLNMVYASSTVSKGRATGLVVATGMKTEVGSIAEMLAGQDPKDEGRNIFHRTGVKIWRTIKNLLGLVGTPLQVKLSKFAILLFVTAIVLAIIVFSANRWKLSNEVLIYGICVALSIVPESLIAVLTITMAVAAKAMAKGNVVVRRMQSLEAVGAVTDICSDKTGTITQGRMIARKIWMPGHAEITVHDTSDPFDPTSGYTSEKGLVLSREAAERNISLVKLLEAVALCNNAVVKHNAVGADCTNDAESGQDCVWDATGEPTEIALQVLALRLGTGKPELATRWNLLQEHPFDSAAKKMSTIYSQANADFSVASVKGAAEVILPDLAVSEEDRSTILDQVERLASEGLRVLCIASKTIHQTLNEAEEDLEKAGASVQITDRSLVESDLDFLGLVGIYDPPRLETADAVRKCQIASIRVHMLTGDHLLTARAIATEVGILSSDLSLYDYDSAIMTAQDFDALTDAEIDELQCLPLVIARCSPSTKVRMVEALHRRKAFCVMTGDGVNDAPALKRADVGFAMGLNGSGVAKDASDMVLTDDNFSSIIKAIEEGRRLFDNIQKFLLHLLVSNIAQVILLMIALAFKDSAGHSVFPLSPIEILWANMITSSFLAIGLGLEEAQPDVMLRSPHLGSVFTKELIIDKMIYGSFMGGLCLAAFSLVVYGAGNGSMGYDCNEGYNDSCTLVFRARSTVFATLTFLLLVTAWEVKHFKRSLFSLDPDKFKGPFAIFKSLYYNRFLFWAVTAGFVITFPVVYLPVVNTSVFKHGSIGWEWGLVLGCLVIYISLVESWKAVKRRYNIGAGARAGQSDVEGVLGGVKQYPSITTTRSTTLNDTETGSTV